MQPGVLASCPGSSGQRQPWTLTPTATCPKGWVWDEAKLTAPMRLTGLPGDRTTAGCCGFVVSECCSICLSGPLCIIHLCPGVWTQARQATSLSCAQALAAPALPGLSGRHAPSPAEHPLIELVPGGLGGGSSVCLCHEIHGRMTALVSLDSHGCVWPRLPWQLSCLLTSVSC